VTTVLFVAVCLLAIVVFILFGALIEMYQQLTQVRDHLDLVDSPSPVGLGKLAGAAPSSVGLPSELDAAKHNVVLLLSNKCQTCFNLAQELSGGTMPAGLWVLVVPIFGGNADDFLEQYQLRGERVLVDQDQRIAERLALDTTPAALIIRDGTLDRAQTVPTVRQLRAILPSPAAAHQVTDPTSRKAPSLVSSVQAN
jgi:hypothetical protein